ncbi:hypothetical protein, partial [Kribbella sp. NPDC048915]|uniref:hypothetical protein n=1 Tax=Kribbella sp. NPDC048915 TaxID=3155148 RepID=UPI0033FF57A0
MNPANNGVRRSRGSGRRSQRDLDGGATSVAARPGWRRDLGGGATWMAARPRWRRDLDGGATS